MTTKVFSDHGPLFVLFQKLVDYRSKSIAWSLPSFVFDGYRIAEPSDVWLVSIEETALASFNRIVKCDETIYLVAVISDLHREVLASVG